MMIRSALLSGILAVSALAPTAHADTFFWGPWFGSGATTSHSNQGVNVNVQTQVNPTIQNESNPKIENNPSYFFWQGGSSRGSSNGGFDCDDLDDRFSSFFHCSDNDDDDNDDDDDDFEDDELSITVTDNESTVEPGDTLTYTIKVLNDTGSRKTGIRVTDSLPTDTTYVSATGSPSRSSRTLTWPTFSLSDGATKTFTVRVRVSTSADDGDRLVNTARISGGDSDEDETRVDDDGDDDDDDNSDDDDGEVSISITDNPDPVAARGLLTYYIQLRNDDNVTRTVDLEAEIDDDTTFNSATGGSSRSGDIIRWDNLSIGRDTTRTVTVTVRVDNTVSTNQTLRFTAETEDDSDTETTRVNSGNNSNGSDELDVTITSDRSDANQGDYVNYTINVRNRSSSQNATGVDLELSYDNDLTVVGSTGVLQDHRIEWYIGSMAPNEQRNFYVTMRVDTDAVNNDQLRTTATVSGNNASSDTDTEDLIVK